MLDKTVQHERVLEMTRSAVLLLVSLLLALAFYGIATAEETASPQTAEASLKQAEEALELTRTERRQIQNGLNRLGFEAGSVDGIFGGNSRWAIRQWQQANGHQATGYLTGSEADALIEEGRDVAMSNWTAGQHFRDCGKCPQMVVVPGGSFMMGSPQSDEDSDDDEGPQHRVSIKKFAVGKYEVTFSEWEACLSAGGCSRRPDDEEWGRGERPVINVSWDDAQEYVRWLSRRTGNVYRLPSESEWEYAARAGTTGPYHTGSKISSGQANFADMSIEVWFDWREAGYPGGGTVPVGSYPSNRFGLHDMHGNVIEWVEDCYGSYDGASSDGSARTPDSDPRFGRNCKRVLRGGSWYSEPGNLRSANRFRHESGDRLIIFGFRVARTLTP